MVNSIKKRYEDFEKYKNIVVYYDEILLFYPDYFKTMIELTRKRFPSKNEIDSYFEENYRNSKFYQELSELAMDEDDIHEIMKHNMDIKYNCLKNLFNCLKKSTITLCKLIDYIGHYPSTWPVATKDEKDEHMEALLEKYDIIVRYSLHDDTDKKYLMSDDIYRIINKLFSNLSALETLDGILDKKNWIFARKIYEDTMINVTEEHINEVKSFPLSVYQKQGKSRVEEGKYYLRLQHGNDII